MEKSIWLSEVTMHSPKLDLLDKIEYYLFRIALLLVFAVWLAGHVIHEVKSMKAEIPATQERQTPSERQLATPRLQP